jgi:[ribosomal protein S5]-alanine N-acetyltransferase
MGRQLIELARKTDPSVRVTAQTLPTENASTRVLQKLGFTRIGEVNHPEDGLVWEWHLL